MFLYFANKLLPRLANTGLLDLTDVESFRNLADDQMWRVISAKLKDLDDADLSKLANCVNLKRLDVSGLMLLFSTLSSLSFLAQAHNL